MPLIGAAQMVPLPGHMCPHMSHYISLRHTMKAAWPNGDAKTWEMMLTNTFNIKHLFKF